jgi:phosphoribosylamine--glycine ligase
MNILILGSGGREHAFAWKLAQSPRCSQLFVAPGNAGTSKLATNLPINLSDFDQLKDVVLAHQINMVVVGPEAPLVEGIRDFFEQDIELKNITLIGPGAKGAELEGSKDFSKAFMKRHHIPTAKSRTFTKESIKEAEQYLDQLSLPVVLKADGLAAGKGVLICYNDREAKRGLHSMLVDGQFGAAGEKVLIEEFLDGTELSVFVLTDGKDYVILPEAKDYKRIGENHTGLNTGGMGAVSPVFIADSDFMHKVEDRVVKRTIAGLKQDEIPYQGFLFIGLMKVKGEPYVIEYNVRMGDPETQVVLPRIENDLVELFDAVGKQKLSSQKLRVKPESAATVVMAAGGYPETYAKGDKISGLEDTPGSLVFQAGTKEQDGNIVTNGGRVLAVTGMGTGLREALKQAYTGVEKLSWNEAYYRRDIGQDVLR